MSNLILSSIGRKDDYLMALEAVTEEKTEFSQEDSEKLLTIYRENAKNNFGFDDEIMVKAALALDIPRANLLDKTNAAALAILCELCKDWEPKPENASAVKDAALSGDVAMPLSLAMARAALDAYAGQDDLDPYREEIKALAEFLKQADKEAFYDASVFLIRVRERVR